MNRRNFLNTSGIAVAGLFAGSCNGLFDKYIEEHKKAELEKARQFTRVALNNIISLSTVMEYIRDDMGMVGSTVNIHGMRVSDYIITVNHGVSPPLFYMVNIPPAPEIVPAEVNKIGEITMINDKTLEEIFKDTDRDIAIFKLPKNYEKQKTKLEIGDSDKLDLYDEVYLISDPLDKIFVPRKERIGSDGDISVKENGSVRWTHDGYMKGRVISSIVIPGESGSPVLNKNGELVGIISHSFLNYSFFKPINWYKEEIKKYEASLKANNQ